jgi:hypothetical protein
MSVPPYTVVDKLPPDGRHDPGGPPSYSWGALVDELRAEHPDRWVRIDAAGEPRSLVVRVARWAPEVKYAFRGGRLYVRVEADQ